MNKEDFTKLKITEEPGVYIFRGSRNEMLYVGKASSLKSRVRSYFSPRLLKDRGPQLVEAVEKTKKIETIPTDSILDALVLEATLIKKHDPKYNARDRDNKSFNFVVITKEDYPRVLIVRGRLLNDLDEKKKYAHIFGPFPQGNVLKEGLKIVRKIFPFRDTCEPLCGKKCFNAQIGLCPGVCDGSISKEDYQRQVKDIALFFSGKKKNLIKSLEKRMMALAKEEKFEEADAIKKKIFALTHIHDVTLIKREFAEGGFKRFRVEAYDVAHTAGEQAVGVMVVMQDTEYKKKEYRTFAIKEAKKRDDIGALKEILERRFAHDEWTYPQLLVIDGGKTQLQTAKKVLKELAIQIPVVSVVKNKQHKAREILGDKKYTYAMEDTIIAANTEAHRFAISKHKQKRDKALLLK